MSSFLVRTATGHRYTTDPSKYSKSTFTRRHNGKLRAAASKRNPPQSRALLTGLVLIGLIGRGSCASHDDASLTFRLKGNSTCTSDNTQATLGFIGERNEGAKEERVFHITNGPYPISKTASACGLPDDLMLLRIRIDDGDKLSAERCVTGDRTIVKTAPGDIKEFRFMWDSCLENHAGRLHVITWMALSKTHITLAAVDFEVWYNQSYGSQSTKTRTKTRRTYKIDRESGFWILEKKTISGSQGLSWTKPKSDEDALQALYNRFLRWSGQL